MTDYQSSICMKPWKRPQSLIASFNRPLLRICRSESVYYLIYWRLRRIYATMGRKWTGCSSSSNAVNVEKTPAPGVPAA